MRHRRGPLALAFALGCSAVLAQDSALYLSRDVLETDLYVFHADHTFKHYSQSLGKLYYGSGVWQDEGKVRTAYFGAKDTTIALADPAWQRIDSVSAFLGPLHYTVSPAQHKFKIKKDKLMYYDHRYSLSERMRGEKAGFLLRQH